MARFTVRRREAEEYPSIMALPSSSVDQTQPAPQPQPATVKPGPVTGYLTAGAERWRWVLLVLVLAFYGLAFQGEFRGQPDSGLHLTIARSLYMGEGFVHPLGDEVRANPGLAYLLAGVMFVGGPEPFALANAVMLGIGLATLGVAFLWFRLHLGRPTAVLLTTFLALSLMFFKYSFQLMTDMPFLLGVMLFLLGWDQLLKRKAVRPGDLALLLCGTAIMVAFRTVAITFLGAVMLALLWHTLRSSDRRVWAAGGVLLVLCIVGLAAALITSHGTSNDNGPRIAADTQLIAGRLQNLGRTLTDTVPENVTRLVTAHMAHAVTGVRPDPYTSSLIGLTAIGFGLALFRRHPLGALLVLAFIVQTLLFIVTERYYLAILPVLLLGWWYAARWLDQRRQWWSVGLCALLLAGWLVPNSIRMGNFVLLQRETPFLDHHGGGRYGALFTLRDWLSEPDTLPSGAAIVTDHRDLHVLVYLTMPLDVTVTSHRHIEAGLDVGSNVYVLEPMNRGVQRLIERQDWRLGRPVLTVPTQRATETLRLRPVVKAKADTE
ncbi:ArnT family glycosyltransferase [Phycisphaerales bacterium AB-hyl4]|uniref:ArnT family glycosyltransferase n=1 Tax=Natronomicrosphaera hydrolytica TaxID=3242702 RepID=A0ABV4U138_9BACT